MTEAFNKYDVHLFVCTNDRKTGASCGAKGGGSLREAVKNKCRDFGENPQHRIRVNASGCLGHCEKGIVAVSYPQGQWHFELENDAKAVDQLTESVRRLITPQKL